MLSSQAGAAIPAPNALVATGSTYQLAGLVWRCGKNDPAMWGTFGNGCLKQKRTYKKNGGSTASSSGQSGNLAVQQPAPPPPPPRQLKLNK